MRILSIGFSVALLSLTVACGDDLKPAGGDADGSTPLADGSPNADAPVGGADAGPADASALIFDVTLTMTFTNQFDGVTLFADLRDDNAPTVSVATGMVVIDASADNVITLVDVLDPGESYTLHYFADRNGNQLCDDPFVGPNDRGWSQAIPAAAGDVALTAASADLVDLGCAPE